MKRLDAFEKSEKCLHRIGKYILAIKKPNRIVELIVGDKKG